MICSHLLETSLVALRMVFDSDRSMGAVLNFNIVKQLRTYAKNSYKNYKNNFERENNY